MAFFDMNYELYILVSVEMKFGCVTLYSGNTEEHAEFDQKFWDGQYGYEHG
jgi:hypothetical protein